MGAQRGRHDHEEVGTHRIPIDFPQTGGARNDALPRDIECQRVAELAPILVQEARALAERLVNRSPGERAA